MRTDVKKRTIWIVVGIIALLLTVQFLFSYRNSKTINENIIARRQAQAIKVNTLDIIRSLHQLDMGLRGYALIPNDEFITPFFTAHERIDTIFSSLRQGLKNQQFDLNEFYAIRDSVRAYFKTTDKMFALLKDGNKDEFMKILKQDVGFKIWIHYQKFEAHVNSFEDEIIEDANRNYQAALTRNYTAIILLILLVLPTLLFTAYRTNKAYDISDELIQSQEKNNLILKNQNETLERLVKERTEEIATQNEEIQSNLEAISKRNEELEEARSIIEQKNQIIEERNKGLGIEVEKQTQHLRQSNQELIRNINQLEQFSYTVSHNLRAPVARLMGLTGILKYAQDKDEAMDIQSKIHDSSQELDKILKDLVLTIEIKKEINNALVEVALDQVINKTVSSFQDLTKEHDIEMIVTVEAKRIKSITAYIESILHNLISNAIKYRSLTRPSKIEITAIYLGEWIEITVSDNGMGIDIQRNKKDLFNFYKRFHFHVEGRGLGLFLVKSQVELLGGTIQVESEVDKGTTFKVRLRHNLKLA